MPRDLFSQRNASTQVWDTPASVSTAIGAWSAIPTASAGTRGVPMRTESTNDALVVPLNVGGTTTNLYPVLSTVSNFDLGGINDTVTEVLTFIINGNGSEIADGVAGDLYVPYAHTITAVTALADQSGSIVVDIWNDTYANYPPTDADSITASAPVTISSATKATDSTLTGWDTSTAAGTTYRFNVDSCTTITRCTVALTITRGL